MMAIHKASRSALFILLNALLLLACGPLTPCRAQSNRGAAEASTRRALEVLDAGLEAMGGIERIRAAGSLTINYRAIGHPLGQNQAFDAPPLDVQRTGARTMIDYEGGRYVSEGETAFPGGYRFNFRVVITPARSFSIDVLKNRRGPTIQSIQPQGQAAARFGMLLEAPHLLLLHLRDRAEALRSLGETRMGGRSYQVISLASEHGAQVTLYFDSRTRLLSRYEQLTSHPLLGDVVYGSVYLDYQPLGGVQMPRRRQDFYAGNITGESEYAEVALNFTAAQALLEVPAGYVEATPPTGEDALPLRKMGDGVYLLQRLGYRVMFIEFKDYVMVLETPTDANISQQVINRIRQTAPGKPIRYVSFSHFHFDHTGGLRQYISEGATILIPPGNRSFVEAIAASRFTIRPDALARKPVQPKIETFTGKRVVTDGERTVELYSIGPVSHVRDIVMFYFPKEKILFQGDLFSQLEAGGMPPIIEINRELVRKVEELGLEVETLIGVHGGAIPWKTFREAVR